MDGCGKRWSTRERKRWEEGWIIGQDSGRRERRAQSADERRMLNVSLQHLGSGTS
jgi:hypothetical protein